MSIRQYNGLTEIHVHGIKDRDGRSAAMVAFAASDPVLLLSEPPGVIAEVSPREETPMNVENKI